jgi:hypothetical protein
MRFAMATPIHPMHHRQHNQRVHYTPASSPTEAPPQRTDTTPSRGYPPATAALSFTKSRFGDLLGAVADGVVGRFVDELIQAADHAAGAGVQVGTPFDEGSGLVPVQPQRLLHRGDQLFPVVLGRGGVIGERCSPTGMNRPAMTGIPGRGDRPQAAPRAGLVSYGPAVRYPSTGRALGAQHSILEACFNPG